MKLLFVHGWGFDGSVWDGVRALLPGEDSEVLDLGYFGPEHIAQPDEPVLGIGHSFGALWLARSMPQALAGLVAINGFDSFVGDDRLQQRSIDRMIARFAEQPAIVLTEFRERCGAPLKIHADWTPLSHDLRRLRDEQAGPFDWPAIALQGIADPIFPERLHANAFADWPDVERISIGGGHLLPLTNPISCADTIRRMLNRLAT